MRDLGLITEIQSNNSIRIIPLLKDTCVGCTSTTCATRGHSFFVSNPRNLEIKVGSQVRIGASILHQTIQAVINLFVPIALSVSLYFLLANITAFSAGAIAAISLITFFILCTTILFITTKFSSKKGEITQVIDYSPKMFTSSKDCEYDS